MKGILAETAKERALILNSADIHRGSLILVNREHGIQGTAASPALTRVSEGRAAGEPDICLERKAAPGSSGSFF